MSIEKRIIQIMMDAILLEDKSGMWYDDSRMDTIKEQNTINNIYHSLELFHKKMMNHKEWTLLKTGNIIQFLRFVDGKKNLKFTITSNIYSYKRLTKDNILLFRGFYL